MLGSGCLCTSHWASTPQWKATKGRHCTWMYLTSSLAANICELAMEFKTFKVKKLRSFESWDVKVNNNSIWNIWNNHPEYIGRCLHTTTAEYHSLLLQPTTAPPGTKNKWFPQTMAPEVFTKRWVIPVKAKPGVKEQLSIPENGEDHFETHYTPQ